jgi:predicted RNA-binding Zn ribbon-like protein
MKTRYSVVVERPRGFLGGSVHEAALRTADILAVLTPWPGNLLAPGAHEERTRLIEVLREYGESEAADISPADLADLRQAAVELRPVFAAADAATAANRMNALIVAHAYPPRLTAHGSTSGWHLHVDSSDDAPWGEWFLTSSCLALAVLLAERQALPAALCASPSCGRPFVNVGRGPARRYCSSTCGTRERVAAHRSSRSRVPAAPSSAPPSSAAPASQPPRG